MGPKLSRRVSGLAFHFEEMSFLDVGADAEKKQLPKLFVDNPGVDREAVHNQVAEMAAEFFEKELAPPNKKR